MKTVKVLVLTGLGINAEGEMGEAFARFGAQVDFKHVNDAFKMPFKELMNYSVAAFPGGFSFGDHLGSGRVLSHLAANLYGRELSGFIKEGRLVLGVCNGFQTLSKLGLLPNTKGNFSQEISLIHNERGEFIDRWVTLKVNASNPSPWLRGLKEMRVPIRHGEGRLVVKDSALDNFLVEHNLDAFWYEGENPNGSHRSLAGITDVGGRVLGMMPHPEACRFQEQDPDFTRSATESVDGLPSPMLLFKNAVDFCREEL